MSYDSPNHQVRREQSFLSVAGNGTSHSRMVNFQKMRLKKVHFRVVTAGTTAGHIAHVYHGTTSIGSVTLTTNVAGYTASSALLDRTVESLEQVHIQNGTDVTGVEVVTYEYEVLPDAAPTA